MSNKFDEHPEAGDEWIAKAMMLGAEMFLDNGAWAPLWNAHIPTITRVFYGATKARACRKLVRHITGVE